MKDQNRKSAAKPAVKNPAPHSIENLPRLVDPGTDDEAERFLAAIYEDRQESSAPPGE